MNTYDRLKAAIKEKERLSLNTNEKWKTELYDILQSATYLRTETGNVSKEVAIQHTCDFLI